MADETNEFVALRDDTIAAYEQATGDVPNDYQMAEIQILVGEYLAEGK